MREKLIKRFANLLMLVGFGLLMYFYKTSQPFTATGITMIAVGILIHAFFGARELKVLQ